MYEEKFSKWEDSQEMILAIIKLSCEVGPRVHLTNITNGQKALEILRNFYGGTDLSTIDISYREISRSTLESFSSIEAYSEHLKRHREKIIQAGENISEWQISSAFRMGLPARLNPYVFQLVHGAKTSGKVLTIDEIVAALVAEEKRTEYDENNEDAKARALKNQKGEKSLSNQNQSANGKKKKPGPCSYCKGPSHNEKQCYYNNSELRKEDWKPHETKLQLTQNWKIEKDSIASKPKKEEKGGKIKKVRSIASESDESDSSNPLRSARITKQCSIEGSTRRLANKSKDPNFWMDSAADRHLCYDKALMHDIKPLTTIPRLAEVADGRLTTVKGIGSITFDLNIRGKRVENTITDVEYAPDLDYHMISTGILDRKGCFIATRSGRLTIVDLEDDTIFMTRTIQSEAEGNSYF